MYADLFRASVELHPDWALWRLLCLGAELQQTQAEIGYAQAGYDYRLAPAVLRYQTTGL